MISYCLQKNESIVTYSFQNGAKEIYQTKGGVEITIAGIGEEKPLLKFGSTATVPSDWSSASVWLYGIVFTAPSYPNCPFTYYELSIGSASPGQTLTLVETPRLNVCKNAHIIAIPELGYSNYDRQWKGGTVGIGLKGITDKCIIQIVNSSGNSFVKQGECPIKYTVACDDGCPEGFCKCSSPEYPGYCCLDCNATANEIRSITQSLKAHNNGR
jgi:hypothetical protein